LWTELQHSAAGRQGDLGWPAPVESSQTSGHPATGNSSLRRVTAAVNANAPPLAADSIRAKPSR
jgi:hypothetical protein